MGDSCTHRFPQRVADDCCGECMVTSRKRLLVCAVKSMRFRLGIIVILLLSPATSLGEPCHLNVAWHHWEPYQYIQHSKTVSGIDVELTNLITEKAGCDVTYVNQPWVRTIKEIELGKVDMAMAATKTPEREVSAFFSKPYRDEHFSVFVARQNVSNYNFPSVSRLLDAKFSLGIVRGFYYGEQFHKGLASNHELFTVVENLNDLGNLKMLSFGRIDGALIETRVGNYLLKTNGYKDRFTKLPLHVNESVVHLMMSKKTVSDETLDRINRAIEDTISSNVYEEILNKFQH